MDALDVVQQARNAHVRTVRFIYCDLGGILRCKTTHIDRLQQRMHEGIGMTHAMSAWTGVETLAAVEGIGPVGEFRLIPDPQSFALLPYVPHAASMMCDQIDSNGSPWPACPRTFLKRMIARLAQQGMRMEAVAEHEFYLARQEGSAYVPADQGLCYATSALNFEADVIDAVLEALEAQGIGIEQFHAELGPSQQELSIHHSEVLQAADNVCLVRETVRGVAYSLGLFASFAPKPFVDQAGSGAHLHFSLWGTDDSKQGNTNLFYDASERGNLSQLGKYFIGGVLHHVHALVALTCGSPNSYQRLLPHFWSSAYAAYGFDNREGAIRIPSVFWGREAQSINLELKPSDHSGNPYLALGALIAAGLDGITKQIDPGEPQEIDPGNYSDQEREQRGIRPLPTSLDEALDVLENDDVLWDALGPQLATAYVTVKRDEIAYFEEKSPEEMALQHFYKY